MEQDGLSLQGLFSAVPLSTEERAELLRAVRKARPAFSPQPPPPPPPQVNTSPLLQEIYAKVSGPASGNLKGAGGHWAPRPLLLSLLAALAARTPCWWMGGCPVQGGPHTAIFGFHMETHPRHSMGVLQGQCTHLKLHS